MHGSSLPDVSRLPLTGERMAYLALVADGVGGHSAGGEASRVALEAIAQYVTHSMKCYYTHDPAQEEEFLERLHDSVMQCDALVRAEGEGQPGLEGMATTLTLLMAIDMRAYVVQVGDSRCYQLRDGELYRVTKDQTVAQELVDHGALTESKADISKWSHVLTSTIGGSEANPVITQIDVDFEDVLLLCSDGLTGHLKDDEIRDYLVNIESAESACRALVGEALERGGSDNVTVVVGRSLPEASAT